MTSCDFGNEDADSIAVLVLYRWWIATLRLPIFGESIPIHADPFLMSIDHWPLSLRTQSTGMQCFAHNIQFPEPNKRIHLIHLLNAHQPFEDDTVPGDQHGHKAVAHSAQMHRPTFLLGPQH